MPQLKQGAFGRSLFQNATPKKAGGFGRTLFGLTNPAGSVFGFVYTTGIEGFHGAELTLVELLEITCRDGSVARFTAHPSDLAYGGQNWQAIPIRRGKIRYHSDLQVDKVDVELGIVGLQVGAKLYTLPQIVRRGFLRQARVRILTVDYEELSWSKVRFDGYVTDAIGYNKGVLSLKVGSLLDRLKEKFPKLVYSEFCQHKLFGPYCGLSKAARQVDGFMGAGSTHQRLYSEVFLFAYQLQGYWERGEVKITDPASGNYNVSRSVLVHGDGYVDLMLPLHEPVAAGETFSAWPGCDKSGETCETKFANYENFFGFEYIPKPEIMYG